jgi:hypothetical protein
MNMFCPKCGSAIPENTMICSNCGFEISSEDIGYSAKEQHTGQMPNRVDKDTAHAGNTWHNVKRVLYPIIGTAVLVMCFMAAKSIGDGGTEIMQISSVGGRTLEEAYYRELGSIYSGYANVVRAFGISLASFLVWLGFKK